MQRGTLDRDVKKACMFCSCKPLALIAAGLDQIQEKLTAVAVRIGANKGAIDCKVGRAGCRAQTKTTVRLIRASLLDENVLTKSIDGYFVVTRISAVAARIGKRDRFFPQPLPEQGFGAESVPRPELHSPRSEQLRELGAAAGFEQAR